MANIKEPVNPEFPPVYLLDFNDDVIGGEEGTSNRQAKQLVERDAYLRQKQEEELEARTKANDVLEGKIDENRQTINAWIGRGGYLNAYDFGVAVPTQEELTAEALRQIPSIEDDPSKIYNATKIKNIFDGHVYVLTNTPDTDPPIYDWADQGILDLLPFEQGVGGYISGANPSVPEKAGYVKAMPGGEGKVIGWDNMTVRTLVISDIFAQQTLPPGQTKYDRLSAVNETENPVLLVNGDYPITLEIGETIDLRWNGTEWRVITNIRVGDIITQLPGTKTPQQKCYEGKYVNWTNRAVTYGVSDAPPPSSIDYYVFRQQTPTIAANARPIVCYHVLGSDWQLYQFNGETSAYTVPEELDPKKWNLLQPNIRVEREACQKLATKDPVTGIVSETDDLAIGDQIAEGPHAGKYITEVIVLGGKYLAGEGGFRPTFVQGGVQQGRIQNIVGKAGDNFGRFSFDGWTGALVSRSPSSGRTSPGTSDNSVVSFVLDASLVVSTGPDVAPVTLSTLFWRRVV